MSDDALEPVSDAQLDALWNAVTRSSPQGTTRNDPPMIGLQSGEASFGVDGLHAKRRRVLPEDGTWVDEDAADPGTRYGPRWRQEEITRQQILERDPNYQFIILVAGASNATVERLYDEDSVGEAMRRRISEHQSRLAGQEAVVEIDTLQASLITQQQNRTDAVRMQGAVLERQTTGFLATAKAHAIATDEYVKTVHARKNRVDLANMLESVCGTTWVAKNLGDLTLRVINAEFAFDEAGGMDPVGVGGSATISALMMWGAAGVANVLDAIEARARADNPQYYVKGADIRRILLGLHASGWNNNEGLRNLNAPEALCVALRRFIVLKYATEDDRNEAIANFVHTRDVDVLVVDGGVRDAVRTDFRETSWRPWLREADALVVFLETAVDLLKETSPLTSPTEEPDPRLTYEETALARGKTAEERRATARTKERRAEAAERRAEAEERRRAEKFAQSKKRSRVVAGADDGDEDLFGGSASSEGRFPSAYRNVFVGAPPPAPRGDDVEDQTALDVRMRIRADNVGRRIMRVADDPDIKRYRAVVAVVRQFVVDGTNKATKDGRNPGKILRKAGLVGGPDLRHDKSFMNSGPRVGEAPENNSAADQKAWATAVAWFEGLGSDLLANLQVEFPMSAKARDDARSGKDVPEWNRASGRSPPMLTMRMKRLWDRHMATLAIADKKVADVAAGVPGPKPSFTLSERIVYQVVRGVTPEKSLQESVSSDAKLVNNSVLVLSARLYEAELAIAAAQLRVTVAGLDDLIALTSDRIGKMMRGEAVVRVVPEAPYEHRRGWVEQPEHSGIVRLIPIVIQSIAAAWNRLRRLAPDIANAVDIEFVQHDPQMRPDFADLVAIEMAFIAQRFPKQYIQLGQRAHTMTDLVSVVQRFRNNFELMRVPGATAPMSYPRPIPGRDVMGRIRPFVANVAPSGHRRGNMILL